MILSCVAGPDNISIKDGFQKDHFINVAAHLAMKNCVDCYKTYPFTPEEAMKGSTLHLDLES